MGVLDSVGGLLRGSGKTTIPVQMQTGETEMTRVSATLRPGTVTSVGGELILTNLRLIFTPWNLGDAASLLGWMLGKAGAPDVFAGLPERVAQLASTQVPMQVASVEAGGTNPATIVVVSADGQRHEFGVNASLWTPVFSTKNAVARDKFVAVARQTLGLS